MKEMENISVEEMDQSLFTLLELSKLQKSLFQYLNTLQSQIMWKQNLLQEPNSMSNNKRVDHSQKRLLDAQNANKNKNLLTKMSLYSQEAFKAMYVIEDNDDNVSSTTYMNIAKTMNTLNQLNKELLTKLKTLSSLENRSKEVKLKLDDVKQNNTNLAVHVQDAEINTNISKRSRIVEKNQEVKSTKCSLEKSFKELTLRKKIFQGLINASKLDWYCDEELCELVVSFGEAIDCS